MMGGFMNGQHPPQQGAPMATITTPLPLDVANAPVVTIQNVSLSSAQLRNLFLGIAGLVSALLGGGYLFIPAKQTDLQALQQVVETVNREAAEDRKAVSRLTEAVDNLSRIVTELPRYVAPPAPVPVPRPRPRPVPKPALTPAE